jgi:hypothetical protein
MLKYKTDDNKNIVRTVGEEFFVQESVRGIYLQKGSFGVMVTTPTDAILIIDTLKKYLEKQHPSFIKQMD